MVLFANNILFSMPSEMVSTAKHCFDIQINTAHSFSDTHFVYFQISGNLKTKLTEQIKIYNSEKAHSVKFLTEINFTDLV